MFTFWLICFIICIVELYYIRTTKFKKKTRKDVIQRWEQVKWEYTKESLKMSRFLIGLYVISSLIPTINFITLIITLATIIRFNIEPKGNDGCELCVYRFYTSGKLLSWLFEKV